MIDAKLIEILRCPLDGGRLRIAEPTAIDRLNEAIERGDVRDRQDQKVSQGVEGGLLDPSGQWLYPIRGGIPSMVADEAIRVPESMTQEQSG